MNDYYLLRRAWARLHTPIDGWLFWLVIAIFTLSLVVLFAVVLAPLYEELLFRRVLFGRLWHAGWPVLGIALSSVIFALVHAALLLVERLLQ